MSVVVAVVVISVSCVGYDGCRSFFEQLFLLKILFSDNSFLAPQNAFYNIFWSTLSLSFWIKT